ncbi:MAG: serine/threonine-protein kinase [Cystobacter sp.]
MDKAPEPGPSGPLSFGPYTLVRRIGHGGMGEVYLAREEVPGRACVVKKVLPGLAGNPQFLARFRDEARVVRRLSHPNIARVWDMGEVDGELYLAMEYVAGKTLNRLAWRLRKLDRMLPVGLALLVAERMCQGLAHAHAVTDEHGHPLHLVHRDLSPANVCISYAGEVKIIDFGAAQSTLKEARTAPSVVMGSLAYMAPEHARKQRVDRRADVYATGVVLWELLSWRPLTQQGDVVERWRRAAYPLWAPPSQHREGLGARVDAVVLKALATDPEARFQDAGSFGEALRSLREELTPRVGDAELARLLGEVFAREKRVEDGVLGELLRGGASPRRTLTEKQMPAFAPPTALAFEHRALDAPLDFLPSSAVTIVDESKGARTPTSREVRVAFDVDLTTHESEVAPREGHSSLVSAEDEDDDADAALVSPPSVPSRAWRAAGLFVAALLLGFLLVWLLG